MKKTLLAALVLTLGSLSCSQTDPQDKKQIAVPVSEEYFLSEGISLDSDLWKELKSGKHIGGAGRDGEQWKIYLSKIEGYREDVLEKLKPKIRKEMEKYRFAIDGLGGGGCWSISHNPIIEWDNFSDLDKVNFDGVHQSYTRDKLSEADRSTIVHEYFHGIWDIFGAFASKETRMINRDMFRADTERLAHDPNYQNTDLMMEIKEGWGLDATEEDIERMRKENPEEIGLDGTIIQALTERFAHLSELYYKNPEQLPNYIQRHLKPFFK